MQPLSPGSINEDMLAMITMLFGVEHKFQEHYVDLSKAEKKLLHDIHEELENLSKWIALSTPHIASDVLLEYIRVTILHEGIAIVGKQYLSEIECWAEDNQDTINDLVERVMVWYETDTSMDEG